MMPWFTISLCLSLLALLFNVVNGGSPHRLRFHVSFLALCSWLVPWQVLAPLFASMAPAPTSLVSPDLSAAALEGTPYLSATAVTHFLSASLVIAFGIGLLLFLSDIRAYMHLLRKFSGTSSTEHRRLPKLEEEALTFTKRPTQVFVQDEIQGAFTTGVLKPRIWVHRNLLDSPNLAAVLLHEVQHLRYRDNFYLWIVTLSERLLWWNPLVRVLGRRTRELQELACDEACTRVLPDYRNMLNRLILALSKPERSVVRSALPGIFHDGNFNVRRVKVLERRFIMKTRHYLSTAILLACSTFAVSWGSAQQPAGEQEAETPDSDSQSQTVRTQQQIIEGLEKYATAMERIYDEQKAEIEALRTEVESLKQQLATAAEQQ